MSRCPAGPYDIIPLSSTPLRHPAVRQVLTTYSRCPARPYDTPPSGTIYRHLKHEVCVWPRSADEPVLQYFSPMREQTSLVQQLFQVRESISCRQTKSRIRFVSVAFVSDSSDLQCDTYAGTFPSAFATTYRVGLPSPRDSCSVL